LNFAAPASHAADIAQGSLLTDSRAVARNARHALLGLQSWRQSMLRLLTLDTLGITLLLVVAVVAPWPHLNRDVLNISLQYGPYIATLLGVLLAAVPVVGMWAEQTRRPIRLL
jgi:hypothetical protein